MSQSVPVDAALGVARTGQAIGCIVYALDGTTVLTAFSVTGWYEAPASSGSFHHAGISSADAGFVVAVGVSGTEYTRVSIEAAKALASDYTSARAVKLDYLDAAIASRSSHSAADVWAATTRTLSTAGVQAIWDALTSAQTTTGSIGKWIVDKLDVVVSTRLATSGYTAPPTVTAIRSEIDTNSTKLDVATSTRASQSTLNALNNLSTTDIDNRIEAFDPPTKAELDTAQAAISALIAALNNLSSAQTQTAVASALSSYGAATGANVTTSQTAVTSAISALNNLSSTQAVAAIMAYVLESGKTFKDANLDIWSVIVGNSAADATDPTQVTYASPDASVQVTHNIAPTTRTHS